MNVALSQLSNTQLIFHSNYLEFFFSGVAWLLVAPSCPTLCDPMDCSPPGSSVHGILQARILEWVTTPFSMRFSQPRDHTWVSRITGRFFTIWAIRRLEIPILYALWLIVKLTKVLQAQSPQQCLSFLLMGCASAYSCLTNFCATQSCTNSQSWEELARVGGGQVIVWEVHLVPSRILIAMAKEMAAKERQGPKVRATNTKSV